MRSFLKLSHKIFVHANQSNLLTCLSCATKLHFSLINYWWCIIKSNKAPEIMVMTPSCHSSYERAKRELKCLSFPLSPFKSDRLMWVSDVCFSDQWQRGFGSYILIWLSTFTNLSCVIIYGADRGVR